MHLPAAVPPHLIHPQVDNDDICDRETEECDLSFDDALVVGALDRVESFGVDDVILTVVLEPHAPGAAFAIVMGVEDWEMRPESRIDKRALP
jgi:hypothetical protein